MLTDYSRSQQPSGESPRQGIPRGKPGPKPWPTGGHNKKIQERIVELEGLGYEHVNGGDLPERVVRTPSGQKGSRRPDITMRAPDGTLYDENVDSQGGSIGTMPAFRYELQRERLCLIGTRWWSAIY